MTLRDRAKWRAGRRRRLCAVAFAGLVAQLALVGPTSAATIADWQMDEPSGATVMTDSSPSGLLGTIGSAVVTGFAFDGATGYRWLGTDTDGVRPERLVTVDNASLNPGTDPYAVTIRLKTGAGNQNIIQKGQSSSAGGFWKIDMHKGRVHCLFRGADGQAAIATAETVWDHKWHTVRCERTATGVSVTLDGGTPRTTTGATGRIENSWPLSIGGKSYCDPSINIGCDYYVGLLDFATIEKTTATAEAPPPDTTKPQVAFTSPTNGDTVAYASTVNLTADASDDVGVTKVDFWVNGTLRCTATTAPYECPWRVWSKVGSKNTLRAVAHDAAGNTATHIIYVYTS